MPTTLTRRNLLTVAWCIVLVLAPVSASASVASTDSAGAGPTAETVNPSPTLAAAATGGSPAPWPTLGGNADRNAYEPTITGPQSQPEKLWSTRLDDQITGAPIVVDGIAYVATGGYDFTTSSYVGRLHGFHTKNGTSAVNISLPSSPTAVPTYAGGVLYVGLRTGSVVGYATNGTEVFNVSARSGSKVGIRSVAVNDSDIYVTGFDDPYTFINAYHRNGTQMFATSVRVENVRAPAVADGKLFVARDRSIFVYSDAATGGRPSSLWSTTEVGEILAAAPAVHDDVVYYTSIDKSNASYTETRTRRNGTLYARNASTGSLLWSQNITARIGTYKDQTHNGYLNQSATSIPLVVNGTVYVGGDRLFGFDAKTGAKQHELDFAYDVAGGAMADSLSATDAGTIYATFAYSTGSERQDDLYAIRDGVTVWSLTTPTYGGTHPTPANDTLFLVDDRKLTAFTDDVPNTPPSAILGLNRTYIRTGDAIAFTASASSDSDGTISEYRWDFDGDGQTDASTTTPTTVHTYGTAGSFDPTVTVVDNDGATDTDSYHRLVVVRSAVTPSGETWPEFAYDEANTGRNASTTGPVPPVEEKWNVSMRAAEPWGPVVWNDLVFSNEDPSLRAINASTGAAEWTTSLRPAEYEYGNDRFDLISSPAVADGVVYVGGFWNDSSAGTAYDYVFAVDATTGTVLWNESWTGTYDFFNNGLGTAPPKVHGDMLYVSSEITDTVYGVNITTQRSVWAYNVKNKASGELRAAPAVTGDTVFVAQGWDGVYGAGQGAHVYALDADVGTVKWDTTVYGVRGATPAVAGDRLYVLTGSATIAYNASNGTQLWAHSGSAGSRHSSPAVAGNTIITLGGGTPDVYALDAADGSEHWTFDGNGSVYGAPAVTNDTVYVATTAGTVYGLELATGTQRFEYQLPNGTRSSVPVYTAPAVANGNVYIRAGSNQLVNRALFALGREVESGSFQGDLVAAPSPAYSNVTSVTLSLTNTSGVSPDHYEWTFGDGTTTKTTHPTASASHTYTTPGSYTGSVAAYAANGSLLMTDDVTITVRQPNGNLTAVPSTADVNVTQVQFSLSNVTGVSPGSYEWDFDGDGQTDATTSHPNATANYTYSQLLGQVTARVVVKNSAGAYRFTESTAVNVHDTIDPVVTATGPAKTRVGTRITINASNSTDNHRIASYTFETDTGQSVTQQSPTHTLSFASAGNHTVNVTARDASGNTNTTTLTIDVREAPDLTVEVTAAETQRLSGDVNATVTVSNDGSDVAENVVVRLNVSAKKSYYNTVETSFTRNLGNLSPDATVTRTISFDSWADGNVTGSRPQVRLRGTVDPGDTVTESDEANNVDRNSTRVGYSDLRAYVVVPWRTIPNESAEVRVYVRNRGSLPSKQHTIHVDFGDGTNRTYNLSSLARFQRNVTVIDHTFASTGIHTVRVNVTDDPLTRGNVNTDRTNTQPFTVSIHRVRAPSKIENDTTFYVSALGRLNYRDDQNATIDLPAGLELVDPTTRNQTATQDLSNVYYWRVRSTNESGASPYQVNITVRSRDKNATASTTIAVTAPKIRLENSSSVAITDTDTENTTIEVRPETTYDHSITVSAQLGAQGRTLDGLEYLFNYPNYCVEQTTSPMLAALNTDQYYRENPAPGGYDRTKVNKSVEIGIDRMTTGANAQHANGAWSMYGNTPSGHMYYTAYALFGTSSVSNDPVQGSRTSIATDLSGVDFNQTVFWIADHQQADGRLANDKHYFEDDQAMTGFVLVALHRAEPFNASANATAQGVRENATDYLVNSQAADGSWGNGNPMSTALAVWGLATSNVSSPDVTNATNAGVSWLVDYQETDGAWPHSKGSSWRNRGTVSETTAYALLALNATAIPASNQTLSKGSTFLVQTYDQGGSWGYTRASSAAIDALLALDVGGSAASQDVTLRFGNESNPALVTKTVNVTSTAPQDSISLTAAERKTLREAGPTITVTVEGAGTGQLVVAIETDQVVNRNEYEAATGGGA